MNSEITDIYVSNYNIIFKDRAGELWIVGDNFGNKTNISKSRVILKPHRLNIRLDENARISRFMSYHHDIFIFVNIFPGSPESPESVSQNILIIPESANKMSYRDTLPIEVRTCDMNSDNEDVDTETISPLRLAIIPFHADLDMSSKSSFHLESDIRTEIFRGCPSLGGSSNISGLASASAQPVLNSRKRKLEEIANSTSETTISTEYCRSWKPLMRHEFMALTEKDRNMYVQAAKRRVVQDFQHDEPWTRQDCLVQQIFCQINNDSQNMDNENKILLENYIFEPPSLNNIKNIPPINTFPRLDRNTVVAQWIDNILFGKECIIYQHQNNLLVDAINTGFTWKDAEFQNRPLSPKVVNCKVGRLLCFEFDPEMITFLRNCIYMRNGDTHHILAPGTYTYTLIEWIFFESDFDIDIKTITWSEYDHTIYLTHDDCIYYYCHGLNRLVKFMSCGAKYFFTRLSFSEEFIAHDDEGLYVGYRLHKILSFCNELKNFVDIVVLPEPGIREVILDKYLDKAYYIVLYNDPTDSSIQHLLLHKIMFVNTAHVRVCNKHDYGLTYIYDDKLHVLTRNTVQIVFRSLSLPVPEASCVIMVNNSVAIKTDTDIYYAFSFDNYHFRSLKEKAKPEINEGIINRAMILPERNAETTSNGITIYTPNVESDYLHKMMAVTELNNANTRLEVRISSSLSSDTANGSGVTRSFFNDTLMSFARTHLKTHNFVTEFCLESFSFYSDRTLFNIGKMLLFSINNLKSHLPIRVPLLLLAAMKRRMFTLREFEYFAMQEDKDAYLTLKEIQHSLKDLKAAGFDNYLHGLKSICHFADFSGTELTKAYHLAIKISEGFLVSGLNTNISTMNIPTFDNYLCGDYVICISSLLKKIDIRLPHQETERITTIIKSLSPSKIRILLANWSGIGVLSTDCMYKIKSGDNLSADLKFITCDRELHLHTRLFAERNDDAIIDMLTTPCIKLRG